jgi:chromosomal replication initiation ATPase DnaA
MSNYSPLSRLRKEFLFLRANLERVMSEIDKFSELNSAPCGSAQEVMDLVSAKYKLAPGAIMAATNAPVISGPRQVAHYLMRNVLGMPLGTIGRVTNMHHTTVAYSCERVAAMRAANPEFDRKIWELEDELRGLGKPDDGFGAIEKRTRQTGIEALRAQ